MTSGIGDAAVAITSDNLHLSEVIRSDWPTAPADVCTRRDGSQPKTRTVE